MPLRLTFLAALIAALPVAALGQADASAKRERLDAERGQAEEIYRRKEAECRTRFAVTACIDAARAERRATLARIRDEELQLDAARRKERAAERLRRIEEQRRESADAPPSSALPAPAPAESPATADTAGAGASRPSAPATTPPASSRVGRATSRAAPRSDAARPADAAADRPTRGASATGAPPGSVEGSRRKRQPLDVRVQQRNRAAYEEKQREARARREAAERRQAERERSGKKAAPLPAPTGPLP
jgi:hypothetical protein